MATPRSRRRASPAGRRPGRAAPAAGRPRGLGALVALSALAAGWYLAAYAWVAVSRMGYPFELEWIEGVVLESVRRVLHGQPIYAAPSLAFVPLNYTPLYYWLCAPVSAALGGEFLPLRLVSFLASLAILALVFGLVRHETRSATAGLVAAGLFAACYRLGGAWLDVARADSLYLALVMAAVAVLRLDRSPTRSALVAGALTALGVLAKQSAAVVMAPLLLWLVLTDRRRGLLASIATAVLAGGAALALDAASHGWFRYYVFEVARRHTMSADLAWAFPLRDLLLRFAPAIAIVALLAARSGARPERATLGFYGALLVGLLGSAWQLTLYRGGYDNVLITAHVGLALAAGVAWGRLRGAAGGTQAGTRLADAASAALVLQLGMLWWNPVRQVPDPGDRAIGQQLVDRIEREPGDVYLPAHPYLAERAGKPSHAHEMPFMDVVKGGHGPIESGLLRSMRSALASHAYPTLILDTRDWLADEAKRAGYVLRARVFTDSTQFWPVTGMRTRPEYVLTPGTGADTTRFH